MWILKNSNYLLEYIQSTSLFSCKNIKYLTTTLYTTIPHSKLQDRLRELDQLCFIKTNGQRIYKYLVLGRNSIYFVKDHSDSTKELSETDIINMLEFWLTTYFACLVNVFFNGHLAYVWVQYVLLFWPTCSFNRMR